jgi:hypothetical protein
MPTTSEGKIVRKKAGEIKKTSPEELARIGAIADQDIDYSDIPEQTGERRRLKRDENGRLPKRRNAIRDAIVLAVQDRNMTAYSLWKEAKAHCPTISETAVGEFLKGQRSIGIEYLEALMIALGLAITPIPPSLEEDWSGEMTERQLAIWNAIRSRVAGREAAK